MSYFVPVSATTIGKKVYGPADQQEMIVGRGNAISEQMYGGARRRKSHRRKSHKKGGSKRRKSRSSKKSAKKSRKHRRHKVVAPVFPM